jgi:DNA-binding SARP family transcriptional activator
MNPMPVRVLLFGPPRLETAADAPPLPRARGRALLAYLGATGQPQTRDALAALLWPDFAPDDARNNLRRELSLLRHALGDDLIAADRAHAGLNRAALADGRLWIDVAAFDALMAAAESHRHAPGELCAECVLWLEEAEALYSADFLAGFSLPDSPPFDEWQTVVGQRLRATLDTVRDRLANWHLGRGDADRALDLVRRRLAADPLNEAAHRQRLRALALSGQWAGALREHEQFARRLAEEMGESPEPATLALVEDVRRQRFAPPVETFGWNVSSPPVDGGETSRRGKTFQRNVSTLPAPTTPFFGRELELAELSRLFADPATRLVTLVGPGGMGKTRLALAWAEMQRDDRSADGVVFVDLAPVPDAGGVLPALADALGFPLQEGTQDARPPLRQIAGYLAPRAMLLLLDNAERLLDAAPLLVDLLAAAPGVRLLVTSRERLGVRPETVYAIDGLALPPPGDAPPTADYAAGRLFVGAARRVQPQFTADSADDRAQVAAIARLVGGMPLALEMAAAWVDSLALPQIAAELARGLDLLETEMRDVPGSAASAPPSIPPGSASMSSTGWSSPACRSSAAA